jgi:tRNA A-37 threonylcarbamoyl transferase component Bud32
LTVEHSVTHQIERSTGRYKTTAQKNKEKRREKMEARLVWKMEQQGVPVQLSGEVYRIDEQSVPECLQ